MSTNNRILAMIGITLVGSLGWAAAHDPDDGPEPPAPGSVAAAAVSQEQFLLLTNGRLIQGVVAQQGTDYLVHQRVGVMKFPKKLVEGAFNSVRDAYQYRVQQLPDRDYDERFKLALWCLNLKLIPEANDLLADIVQHNPNHKQAQAMLVSIGNAATRAALRPRDPDVRQTRAEEMADNRPGALDSGVLRRAQRDMGIANVPVIFDLPVPLAVKRAQEFARYISPLLQENCAKCHNGEYNGEFQLVSTKTRADRTPEAFRANLDATLRLVNRENPSRSELLSSTLRPHGLGPRKRPIFPGSNDPTYSIIAAWVHNLCPPKLGEEANRAERGPVRTDRVETFAADRDQIGRGYQDGDLVAPSGRSPRSEFAAGMAAETRIPPPSRYVPGGPVSTGAKTAEPEEFPLPFAVTGVKPNLAPETGASKQTAKPTATPKPDSPGAGSNPSADQATGKNGSGTAKTTTKPLTLDPKILERALQNRNAGR